MAFRSRIQKPKTLGRIPGIGPNAVKKTLGNLPGIGPHAPRRALGRAAPRSNSEITAEKLQTQIDNAIRQGAPPKIIRVLQSKLSNILRQQNVAPQPQEQGFAPQEQGFAPQEQGFAPQEQMQEAQSQEQEPQQEQAQAQEQESQEQPPQEQVQEDPQQQVEAGNEVAIPLISSHKRNGKMHTAAICVTPYGHSVVHCRTPISNAKFGVERTLHKHKQIIKSKTQTEKQKRYAGELVERSRQGDQNAMAIIALVRVNANNKNPRAIKSFELLKEYIDKNPAKDPNGPFGYYTEAGQYIGDQTYQLSSFGWDSTMIANGPRLNNTKISRVLSTFGAQEDINTFMQGMRTWRTNHDKEHVALRAELNEHKRKILELGQMLGRARAIQYVRQPHSEIRKFDARTAWELGE